MASSSHDVIVLGAGGVGSAALAHLAWRGQRVLGLDRFPPVHDRGSSHGETRIIRKAYFEHPDYVPLLQRAYELWDELAARSARSDLFERNGLVLMGPPEGEIITGVLASAREHSLPIESLSATECTRLLPAYRLPEGYTCLLERDAGLLRVEDCVRAHLDQALAHGAELRTGITVLGWRETSEGIEVETDAGRFAARSLVITAGAWAPQLLRDLGVPMHVLRKPLFWLQARSEAHRLSAGCPCFFYDLPEGQFYGFPELAPGDGVKLARHSGGELIPDPLTVNRDLDHADLTHVQRFAEQWFPHCSTELLNHATCLYTMSPDQHFMVDRHPGCPRVVFTAGLSGHGFKFASVLGEIMADLATTGRTSLPAGFLGLARFHGGAASADDKTKPGRALHERTSGPEGLKKQ